MTRLKGLYILNDDAFDLVYGPEERHRIETHVDLLAPQKTRDAINQNRSLLKNVDVIFSGWGAPLLDQPFLDAAPNLKAFFHAAGTVGYCITDAIWRRGLLVTTANAANAIPVAEYTLATILFSLKHGWKLARQTRELRRFVDRDAAPGAFGSTVGLTSLGASGRAVLRLLAPCDLNVVVYDPLLTSAEAAQLRVRRVSLEELFRVCDVVSLHTPVLAETTGMVTGQHFASMKPGATFINTARGELVRQPEMLDIAARRPDLQFVLDVVTPEPPEPDSPLYTLPNVVLTPHIAGSTGPECRRLGRFMVEELERYVTGQPLKWQVTPELAQHSTHRPVTVTTFVKQKPPLPKPGATPVPSGQ